MLRAYAVYDTEVGYCQGMNFLAGLLLAYMPNEACAFGGLVVLMQERKLRELYKTDLAQLQVRLPLHPHVLTSIQCSDTLAAQLHASYAYPGK